jgi:hypothetical protein
MTRIYPNSFTSMGIESRRVARRDQLLAGSIEFDLSRAGRKNADRRRASVLLSFEIVTESVSGC